MNKPKGLSLPTIHSGSNPGLGGPASHTKMIRRTKGQYFSNIIVYILKIEIHVID